MNNIIKKINKKVGLVLVIFLLGIIIYPNKIFAATISTSSDSAVSSGDTSIINIFLDTEGELINTIDGSVAFGDDHSGNFEVKDISLVNSVFSMWPRKPSLDEGHKISFVGGVPSGIKGNRLLLFKVIVKINESGNFYITPSNITSYLNDGLATPRFITKDISTISVGVSNDTQIDRWKEIISNDNIAPEPFTVNLVQDINLYDGKKFLFFEAIDSQSGISYYEVREGIYPAVRTGTSYVLIDQNKTDDIVVTAYDKAGNFQVATLKVKEPIHWVSIVAYVILILCFYFLFKKIRKNKKK